MKTRSKKAAALVLALCLLAGCQGKDAPEGDDAPDTAPIGSGTLQDVYKRQNMGFASLYITKGTGNRGNQGENSGGHPGV